MTKILLSLVFFHSMVFAYDYYNSRMSVYTHPISMVSTLMQGYTLYLTVECPLNESYSIIVNPSFIYSFRAMGDYEKSSSYYYSRIGSGVGVRYFIGDKISDGFYLQLMPSTYRFRNDFTSGTIIDILGYIGYSFKSFSGVIKSGIFLDMGIGIMGYGNRSDIPFWLLYGSAGNGIVSTDVNFGVSLGF
ncbi:MAG: hypothetical protein LBH25_03790 [Fibromonadaceae bacterium]|nr:hypothetical protein [Fibromonadaceae bacterium]